VVAGGEQAAERSALTTANGYCAQQGRVFVPAMMGRSDDFQNGVQNPYVRGYTVTFSCLPQNDPRVAAYRVQPAPDVIVEKRTQ
jgi:hypothetical protein